MTDPTIRTPSPDCVLRLKPYVPGKPIDELKRELGLERVVKLASNENPLGPSPRAIEAIAAAASGLHRYPDPATHDLRHRLADMHGVAPYEIVVGNGSNEIISLLVSAFCRPPFRAVTSRYAFIAYRVVTGAAGAELVEVPDVGLRADVDAMIAACDDDTRLLFIANPNNPTGTWNSRGELERLLDGVPPHVLVVIDEAYREYVDIPDWADGVALRARRPNTVVLRTFSKVYALAGCRVGYAVCPPYVAERLSRIREPFNVNHLGQVGALAALDDSDWIARAVETNARVRAALADGLDALGVRWVPSQTNFLLMEAPGGGAAIYDALLHEGVIARPLQPYGLTDYLRVTVGTDEENVFFLDALARVLNRG